MRDREPSFTEYERLRIRDIAVALLDVASATGPQGARPRYRGLMHLEEEALFLENLIKEIKG